MKIENVTIETKIKYVEDEEYGSRTNPIDVLEIVILLPGGQAIYEIPLEKAQKSSLEYAAKLAKEGTK